MRVISSSADQWALLLTEVHSDKKFPGAVYRCGAYEQWYPIIQVEIHWSKVANFITKLHAMLQMMDTMKQLRVMLQK